MIYLATPYSHKDKKIEHERFDKVTTVTGKLLMKGEVVFSPITHCHEIAQRCELPTNWEWWINIDKVYLSKCSRLFILTLDGWRQSKGVNAEIGLATEMGIPISLVDEDLNISTYIL